MLSRFFRKKPISATVFLQAAEEGNLNIINKYIAENKSNPDAINVTNKSGQTALILAAMKGYRTIANVLLAVPGINLFSPVDRNYSAAETARINGHVEIYHAISYAMHMSDHDSSSSMEFVGLENDILNDSPSSSSKSSLLLHRQ